MAWGPQSELERRMYLRVPPSPETIAEINRLGYNFATRGRDTVGLINKWDQHPVVELQCDGDLDRGAKELLKWLKDAIAVRDNAELQSRLERLIPIAEWANEQKGATPNA